MSAPDTNVKKQADKHKAPLMGMGGVVIFGSILLLGLLIWVVANGNTPGESDETVEGTAAVEAEG